VAPPRWFSWFWTRRLFVLLAVTYAYFFQGGDPNQATRILLTKAIVDRGEPHITAYHAVTIDKSQKDGRFFSDKAPTVSLLATIPWKLMNVLDRLAGIDASSRAAQRARLHVVVIAVSVAAGVIAAWLLRRVLLLFGSKERDADLVTLGYGLGTLAFPFSTVLFGHQTAAAILLGAFWLTVSVKDRRAYSTRRLFALGLLWSWSMITEYPTGILVACMGIYVLAADLRGRSIARVLGWSALGAVLPFALHSLFLWWAFGNPTKLPYTYMAEPIFLAHTSTGILGINVPTFVGMFGSLYSRYRGLFFLCPFLLLTFAGFRAWLLAEERKPELRLVAAMCIAYVLFNAGYFAWDGGGSTGPRHLVPVLPYLVMPIGFFLDGTRFTRAVTWTALVPSAAIMLACTAVCIQVPEGDPFRANPLYQIVVTAIAHGEVASNHQDVFSTAPRADASYNLGMLFGLQGVASLVPLLVVWFGLFPRARREQAA
jgi:hypothetical protein